MHFQKRERLSALIVISLCISCQCFLQALGQRQRPAQAQASADNVDATIDQLKRRITFGVNKGTIQADDAAKLRNNIQQIGAQAAAARKAHGGKMNPTELAGFQSQLNQKTNTIQSYNQAGTRKAAGSHAVGPRWVAGADGAQNAQKLKQRMKGQAKVQSRQYRQAMMQVKEQQQQEYEKQMLEKLGSQRPDILKKKEDLEQVRQKTGAN